VTRDPLLPQEAGHLDREIYRTNFRQSLDPAALRLRVPQPAAFASRTAGRARPRVEFPRTHEGLQIDGQGEHQGADPWYWCGVTSRVATAGHPFWFIGQPPDEPSGLSNLFREKRPYFNSDSVRRDSFLGQVSIAHQFCYLRRLCSLHSKYTPNNILRSTFVVQSPDADGCRITREPLCDSPREIGSSSVSGELGWCPKPALW
jgi:hypothetical protein